MRNVFLCQVKNKNNLQNVHIYIFCAAADDLCSRKPRMENWRKTIENTTSSVRIWLSQVMNKTFAWLLNTYTILYTICAFKNHLRYAIKYKTHTHTCTQSRGREPNLYSAYKLRAHTLARQPKYHINKNDNKTKMRSRAISWSCRTVCVCVVCVVYIEWAASDDHSLVRWAYSTARAVSQVVARARRILMYKLRAPQYSLALRPAAPQSDDIYIRIYYTYAAPLRTKYYLIVTRDHDFFFASDQEKL